MNNNDADIIKNIAKNTFHAYMNINMYGIESYDPRGENRDGWVRMRYSRDKLFRMQQLLDHLVCEVFADREKESDIYRKSILEAILDEWQERRHEPRECAKMWYGLGRKAFDTEYCTWSSSEKEIKPYEQKPYVPPDTYDSDDYSE